MNIDNALKNANPEVELNNKLVKAMAQYRPGKLSLLPVETQNLLRDEGIYVGEFEIKHDEVLKKIVSLADSIQIEDLTNSYVVGVVTGKLYRCSGLVAKLITDKMKFHEFVQGSSCRCAVCSSMQLSKEDFTFWNIVRLRLGGMVSTEIRQLLINLFFASEFDISPPEKSIRDKFWEIINEIKRLSPSAKPIDVQKLLLNALPYKANAEIRQNIVEHLGAISVLESFGKEGFLKKYTNIGLAPSKYHNSDWSYPIDWWTGKDGVNEDALETLFGHLK